jgi:thiamine-phosphate pyrophosphorylase
VGDKLIGLSTHTEEEARAAIAAGADYIGVGPIFATQTKEDAAEPVGLDYLDYIVKNVPIPVAAIGGIKAHNLAEVCRRGAATACIVTDIVGATDIAGKVRELREIMKS